MLRKLLYLIIIIALNVAPTNAQDVVSDLLGRINTLRANLGLSPYTLRPSLSAAAQNQAQWMANTGQVSHVQPDGSRPVDRAQANAYPSSWVGENIYIGGLATVDDAWNFWLNSAIHYAGLTSSNYNDVGIAMARGENGQAFVLVFGNSGSNSRGSSTVSSNNDNTSSAPAAPPLAIIGNDEFGNIQYELQEGDTLGDILLLFAYTWEDLPALMALNNLTDADIRSLEVGQVLLVPPAEGTWTATPVEATAEITEEVAVEMIEAIIEPINNNEELAAPATFIASTATTSPRATQALVISTAIPTQALIIPTPFPENTAPQTAAQSSPPAWLIAAIIVQVAVLIYASYELLKRWRA
jgi:Cysteine-rich secretory protein family/LysM domain